MSKVPYYVHGDFNALCDVCGSKRKGSELRERWDGQMVCKPTVQDGCWEPRHPQELIKPPRIEQPIPWTRPESADVYVTDGAICTVFGRQAISDFAVSDCAISDTDFGARDF